MNANFIVWQIFSVEDHGQAEIVSISPGFEKFWMIPARAFAGMPGAGAMRFIPQVGRELLSELYTESLNVAGSANKERNVN